MERPGCPLPELPTVSTPQAITHFYLQHHDWLRGWLHRRLGHAGDAADFAHDTYVRVMESRTALEDIQEPRAFLTVVAKRVVANHLRRREIEQAYLETLAHQPEPLVQSPEERAIVLETLAELDQLLDGLPPKVRTAFLYAQLDGLPYAEIAELLDVSLSSVKQYMARAIRHCYFPETVA